MSASKIDSINRRIFGKEKAYDLWDVYHCLMISYGYIPFDDFQKMDADLVNGLVIRINKMNEKGSNAGKRGRF